MVSSFSFTIAHRLHYSIHTYIRLKKVDKRNLNRESYIDMHTVNYLGLVQIQIHYTVQGSLGSIFPPYTIIYNHARML